jgi:hypothetical protein
MNEKMKNTIYDKKATEQSKNAIFIWIAAGLIYILISPSIKLFSIIGLLWLLPGIFIASLLSMPLFLFKNKIALDVIEKKQDQKGKYIPVINFLDIVFAIFWPILYLFILNKFL